MFFYLGAKFGRQVLNIAGSAADDSQPLLPDEKISEEIKKILTEEPPQFTFHDVLNEPLKVDAPKIAPVTKTVPLKTVVEKTKKSEEDLIKIKTTPTPSKSLLDDPATVSVPQKQYRLQVGSFSDKKKAQTSQAIWQARGYSVSLVSSEIPGKGTWFKLYVGGFNSLDDVQAAQKKIMNQYKQSAMILQ
jgi:cell division protein FtsN